jgi:hypothetical protein
MANRKGETMPREIVQERDVEPRNKFLPRRHRYVDEELFEHNGNVWNQQVLPPRLLWAREHEPDVWRRVYRLSGAPPSPT